MRKARRRRGRGGALGPLNCASPRRRGRGGALGPLNCASPRRRGRGGALGPLNCASPRRRGRGGALGPLKCARPPEVCKFGHGGLARGGEEDRAYLGAVVCPILIFSRCDCYWQSLRFARREVAAAAPLTCARPCRRPANRGPS